MTWITVVNVNKIGQDLQLTLTHTDWDQCEFSLSLARCCRIPSFVCERNQELDMIVSYCNAGYCTFLPRALLVFICLCSIPTLGKLGCGHPTGQHFFGSRHDIEIPVVPCKAVAEVSKIVNL